MAGKTIDQVLGYVTLTGLIQKVKTGIPDVLPPAFQSLTKKVLGDAGRYTQVIGTRQVAHQVERYGKAYNRTLKDVEAVDVKLIHFKEMIQLDVGTYMALRNYTNYEAQDMGAEEVARQQSEARKYFDNARLACQLSMMANGSIWFDGSGNLLPTSSGSAFTVGFNVPSGNQSQLNVDGTGNIINVSWALPNSDIPKQIRTLRQKAAQQHGYPLKYAFYGVNVPSYMTQNNYVIDYLSRNPNFAQKWLDAAEVPDGLFGLTWVPVYTAFFQDSAGTNQTIFGGDTVVFTPDITRDYYELLEGTTPVPTSFNFFGDLTSTMGSFKEVQGMYSYAVPWHDPPTAQFYNGDLQIPVLKLGIATYQATVAF